MYSRLGSAMVPHAMPKRKKRGFVRPRNRPGSAPPSRSRRPRPRPSAEPTPVAPHERERRSTPPIPAPRVSWRLLPNHQFRHRYVHRLRERNSDFSFRFFFARVCGSENSRKCACRFRENREFFRRARGVDRVSRDAPILKVSLQTRSGGRTRVRSLIARPRARARDARATHRASQESTLRVPTLAGTSPRVFATSASSRRRARAYHRRDSRDREPRRFAATRLPLEPPERSAFRGRWPPTGRFARPRIDHGKTSTPTPRRRRKLVASSVPPRLPALPDCRFRRRLSTHSRRVRASRVRRAARSRRARRAARDVEGAGGRDARTRRHDSHVLSPLRRARARGERSSGPPVVAPSLSRATRRHGSATRARVRPVSDRRG